MKHPVHMKARTRLGRHAIGRQALVLAVLVVVSLAVALAASACGSKGKPASSGTPTLYPRATPRARSGSPGTPPSKGSSATISPTSSASPTGKRASDATIRAGILRRLSQEPTLVGIQFIVHVRGAVVRIYGTVKTQAQLATAQQIAVSEPDITKVISYIKVKSQTGY